MIWVNWTTEQPASVTPLWQILQHAGELPEEPSSSTVDRMSLAGTEKHDNASVPNPNRFFTVSRRTSAGMP